MIIATTHSQLDIFLRRTGNYNIIMSWELDHEPWKTVFAIHREIGGDCTLQVLVEVACILMSSAASRPVPPVHLSSCTFCRLMIKAYTLRCDNMAKQFFKKKKKNTYPIIHFLMAVKHFFLPSGKKTQYHVGFLTLVQTVPSIYFYRWAVITARLH